MSPDDRQYTSEHEWVRAEAEGRVRIGITAYAQEQLGDIVFVSLPEIGVELTAGQAFGEVESTKSVSEVYAPLGGRVVARNEAIETRPETINADPYGEGWIVELELADAGASGGLLSAAEYDALVEGR